MSTCATQFSEVDVDIRNIQKNKKNYETDVDIHNTIFLKRMSTSVTQFSEADVDIRNGNESKC